jgi:hypothetical protein
MVATALRIGVLSFAMGAHGELRHGSPLPIIREGPDDAVSWATVYAGGGPVTFIPTSSPIDIRYTLRADRDVSRNKAGQGTGPAFADLKAGECFFVDRPYFHRINAAEGWSSGDCSEKFLKTGSECPDLHFTAQVLDVAGDSELFRLGIDKRPKSHTLYNSPYNYCTAAAH